jgi:hypothetical protein
MTAAPIDPVMATEPWVETREHLGQKRQEMATEAAAAEQAWAQLRALAKMLPAPGW